METNKKILGPLGVIFTIISAIVSLIVGGFTIYFYLKKDNPKLEVTTYSEQLITQQRNIDNLKATYVYKDSLEVNNLWQSKCIIRNVGKNTIVGQGENSTLIDDGIRFSFSDSVKVLYCDITNNTIDAKNINNSITFKQWRSNEYVEISALIESVECPQFKINDRDIIDADVNYKQISITDGGERLIKYLPQELAYILRYVWLIYQICFTFLTFSILRRLMQRSINILRVGLTYVIFGDIVKKCSDNALLTLCCIVVYIILFLPVLWLF